MLKKDLAEYKRKYDMYRHHAWAGGILLSVLMSIRVLLDILGVSNIPDFIIFPIGIILVFYVLISIFFTYKYRSGLTVQQGEKIIQVKTTSDDVKREKIHAKVEKEKLKLEKKKAKAEVKKKIENKL